MKKTLLLRLLVFVFMSTTCNIKANDFAANSKDIGIGKSLGGINTLTVTATSTDQTCIGDGSAKVLVENTEVGADLEYAIYKLPNTSEPVRPVVKVEVSGSTHEQLFNGLPVGNYRVVVTQTVGTESNTKSVEFTVGDKYVPVNFIGVSQAVDCTGTLVTFNTSGGNPVEYRILKRSDLSVVRPFQSSKVFSDVPAGDYRMTVKDACGQEFSKDIIVNDMHSNFSLVTTTPWVSLNNADCTSYYVRPAISGNIKYPVTVNMTMKSNTDGSVVGTGSHTYNDLNDKYNFSFPIQSGKMDLVTDVTDACGKVVSATQTYDPTPAVLYDLNGTAASGCNRGYIEFYYVSGIRKYGPNNDQIKVEFIEYPAGFQPWDSDYDFASGSYSAIIPSTSSRSRVGNDMGLPDGSYKLRVYDDCGKESIISFSTGNTKPLLLTGRTTPTCSVGKGSVRLYLTQDGSYDSKTASLSTIKITSAPAEFVSLYGPLPYDGSSYISSDPNTLGEFFMTDLPVGDYTAEATSGCKAGTATNSFKVEDLQYSMETPILNRNCGSFDLTMKGTSTTGDKNLVGKEPNDLRINQNLWYLQQKQSNGTWENVTPNGDFNISGQTRSYTIEGDFRVVQTHYSYGNGVIGRIACDPKVLYEFSYSYKTKIADYSVFQCVGNKVNVAVDAEGKDPFKYELVSKNGDTSFYVDNGTDPVFVNLDAANYMLRVTDGCSNVTMINIDATKSDLPRIKPSNMCDGQNGFLYLSGLSFLKIEWTKSTDPSTVIARGNRLNFEPYNKATNQGTYIAHLSYPNNPSSCINQDITFTLTDANETTPEAGTGQTVTLYSNTLTGDVDLFDYVTGPYDNYGDWTETTATPSKLLVGSKWNAKGATAGTYTFKYTVPGTCTGEDTTTVTIILKSACTVAGKNGTPTPSLVGISNLSQHRVSTWPSDIKNAHLVLESNTKGFVLTRTESDKIPQPIKGMLIWDTKDKCIKLYSDLGWHCINQTCNN